MVVKKRCDICNKEVSLGNWSKHIITTKHKNLLKVQEQRVIHCWICNARVDRDTWIDHVKSSSHKHNTSVLKSKLPKPSNKRKCFLKNKIWNKHLESEEHSNNLFTRCNICDQMIHKDGYSQHLKSQKHIRNVKNKAIVHCDVCDKDIYLKDYNAHSRVHLRKVMTLMRNLPSDPDIFESHHSERKVMGPFVIVPYLHRRRGKFPFVSSMYKIEVNTKYR